MFFHWTLPEFLLHLNAKDFALARSLGGFQQRWVPLGDGAGQEHRLEVSTWAWCSHVPAAPFHAEVLGTDAAVRSQSASRCLPCIRGAGNPIASLQPAINASAKPTPEMSPPISRTTSPTGGLGLRPVSARNVVGSSSAPARGTPRNPGSPLQP